MYSNTLTKHGLVSVGLKQLLSHFNTFVVIALTYQPKKKKKTKNKCVETSIKKKKKYNNDSPIDTLLYTKKKKKTIYIIHSKCM